eukprot:PhF_6_TR28965/c0_g1_i1/m.42238
MQRSPILCIPLYHQNSLPLNSKRKWYGNWGYKRFAYRPTMVTNVGQRVLTNVDRDWLHYAMESRLRQWVLYRRVAWKPTHDRAKENTLFYRRRRVHMINNSFNAFMQYKIMKMLEEQAQCVDKYGQVAVNQALGDTLSSVNEKKKQDRLDTIQRKVLTIPPSRPVTRHVATMYQIHNDRFNMKWRGF